MEIRSSSPVAVVGAGTMGANYPEGPLSWARRVGHHRVRTALAWIAAGTGDTIYIPSRYFAGADA
jgi:hypothetical protein